MKPIKTMALEYAIHMKASVINMNTMHEWCENNLEKYSWKCHVDGVRSSYKSEFQFCFSFANKKDAALFRLLFPSV